MKRKGVSIRRFAALAGAALFLAFMAFTAFAADVSVNFTADGSSGHIIYNHNGIGVSPLTVGYRLQLIKSPDAIINPPGGSAGEMGGNDTLVTTETVSVGDGSAVAGTFVKFISAVPSGYYVYVRAWEGSTPSGATYFGNSNMIQVNLSDPPSVVDFNVNSFATTQLKVSPIITSVVATGVDHDDAVVTINVNSATPVASGTSFLSGYAYLFEWKKSSQSWPQGSQYQNTASYGIEGLDSGVTYNVRVKAANYFGESGYSEMLFTTEAYAGPVSGVASGLRIELNPSGHSLGSVRLTWEAIETNTCEVYSSTDPSANFSLLATINTGGPAFSYIDETPGTERYYRVKAKSGFYAQETVGKYTFTLKKTTTGINSISMPLSTNVAGNSPLIVDASDVAASIGSNFEFIGGWDKATQTDFGYLKTGEGIDFDIEKGVGYQVSVAADTNFVVVGQK